MSVLLLILQRHYRHIFTVFYPLHKINSSRHNNIIVFEIRHYNANSLSPKGVAGFIGGRPHGPKCGPPSMSQVHVVYCHKPAAHYYTLPQENLVKKFRNLTKENIIKQRKVVKLSITTITTRKLWQRKTTF